MTDRRPETDTKLNMSLDDLIGKSTRDQRPDRGAGRGFSSWGGSQGRGGPGRGQFNRNGEQGFGRAPRLTNSGLIMPSFGHPFGGFPQAQPFVEHPMGFAPMPFGFMPPDRMMGMHAEPPMPPNMPAGSFFRSGMPPVDIGEAEPPVPAGPAAVPQARLEEESGQVTVTFKGNQIVKISRSGAMTLDSGGVRGPAVFMALNAVLNVVGVSITRPKKDDEWSIADGRSLTRFTDGVVLPAKGTQSTQRGPKILAAFGGADPSAAAAATAASNAAAAAAGIILNNRPASGRGRGERGTPMRGRGGFGAGRGQERRQENGLGAAKTEEPGSGGKSEEDRIRRLAAKGRYRPY